MATDATGAPTPLGIPTYNINVDAPSGNGFNAAMSAIDTLIAARATLASPALTGNPTAPTPLSGDNDTSIATTAFVASLAAQIMPSGTVLPYAGSTAPTGFLMADGSAVDRTTYATLFGVVGTTYGAGNGTTTFNLPDMRGRVAMGAGTAVGAAGATAHALGAAGGEETHLLSTVEMPSHDHGGSVNPETTDHTHAGTTNIEGSSHSHTYLQPTAVNPVTSGTGTGGQGVSLASNSTSTQSANHTHTFTTGGRSSNHTHTINAQGGGGSHNNLQPFTVVNHIVKT